MVLSGIKVVEYATYVAGPGCGVLFADWGAEVTKIEAPRGDPQRNFLEAVGVKDGPNPVFDLDNRGKRDIVVDTRTEAGLEIVHKLVRDADVFITNVRPGGLERSGLDYSSLSKLNPRLVYGSVTGYGLVGPEKDRPGFDAAAFWCRTGMARLTGLRGADPIPIRTGVGDHTTSMALMSGILAALVERGRTGRGRLVESSLVRSAIWAMGSDAAICLSYGRIASTRPRADQNIPAGNFFKTKDDRWFAVYPRGSADWPQVCAIADQAEIATDPRFDTSLKRREHRAEIVGLLDQGFARFTFEECARRLDDADLVWAPVQTLNEALADKQIRAAGAVVDTPDGNGGTFEAPAGPIRFPGIDDGPKGPTPRLGEHTAAVLTELGYSADQIEQMVVDGAVKLG